MNLRATTLCATAALFLAIGSPRQATAQEDGFDERAASNERERSETKRDPSDIYKGVIPGKRDTLKHLDAGKPGQGHITWIGFLPEETRTRVFIQASEKTDYQQSSGTQGSQLILTFDNTTLENYNLNRFIDASHFNRAVQRIDVKRKGKTITVTLTVTPGASPNIRRSDGYIYLDFPHSAR